MLSNVFISYTEADRAAALATQAALREGGVSAFMAANSIEPGAPWPAELDRAIRTADLVLVLASRAACQSPWVLNEVGVAIGARRKIIPVVWDMPSSELPAMMAGLQALDLAGQTPDTARQAFQGICERLQATALQRLAVAAGVVGLLAALR